VTPSGDLITASSSSVGGATHHDALGHRLVCRRRLFERLSAVPAGGVVMVSAPAGSGKSVLLRSWVDAAQLGHQVAWVSVERRERDAQRFWLAVIDELARAAGGDRLVGPVSPAPRFCADVVVAHLLTELEALEDPVLLVIDDLHELDSRDALRCLRRFLERLPACVRVALGTRREPRLGLHRLRLAGRLTEIQGQELRFSVDEARELLEQAGIALADEAVAVLEKRTEGWAAGLRLAAIALAHQPDPERWVSEFSGSERLVADYLLAEVLERQPPEVRDLLVRTSVLERVSGPLADALTGGSGSERILQSLEDANAFVTAADAGRTWFRYHHLLADLLRRELRQIVPTIIGSLHRAAADWYEHEGFIVDAIRHAEAACDWPHASRLLAEHTLDLILDGRLDTVQALLAALPIGAREADAELAVAFAGAAIAGGSLDDAEVYLQDAQALTARVPEQRRRRFELRLAHQRLWLASWRGDIGAVEEAAQSLQAALAAPTPAELARERELHVTALLLLGTAELWSSQVKEAREHLDRGRVLARSLGRPYLEIASLAQLAIASLLDGAPVSVMIELTDEAVALGEVHGWAEHAIISTPLAARGTVMVWLGRFDEAQRSFERAQRTRRHDREPGLAFLLSYGLGVLRFVQGRPDDALAALTAAERGLKLLASEHTLSLELQSHLIQVHVACGDLAAGRAVLAAIAPPLCDRPPIRNARGVMALAEGRPDEAVGVLAPALRGADEPIRLTWARIRSLVLDAVAREQLGDSRAAEISLDRALELAGPDRIVLPFVSPPAPDLMKHHARRRTAQPALLAAILEVLAGSSAPASPAAGHADELSPAELRVLSYLPGDLNTDEIASELYVSVNTVRTHIRHIYAKLDAHTRHQAVARARELGLLLRR
jgi:LuxR family transcriptional regulator, maltose regulon positive regulatory protein